MLFQTKTRSAGHLATFLADEDLHCEDDKEYANETDVVEECVEHVELTLSKLAGVDQIEDLHHHERLEHHGVECAFRCRPVIRVIVNSIICEIVEDWIVAV